MDLDIGGVVVDFARLKFAVNDARVKLLVVAVGLAVVVRAVDLP